ncbi:MAG TPA: pilus assembly protein TadG-related protein [Candidatus Limnocylindrales bacterium]|nr:pilus assembly protein TadG-related protein [Candidatus Limnocylindrales bacterium]
MRRDELARRGERGQILIMFVLAIFVVVGVVGLVIDGGGAYAQRRGEQSVVDLAAMAGGTAFLNVPGDYATKNALAEAAARQIATDNGYTHGVNGTSIDVSLTNLSYATYITVDLTGKHGNTFAGLLGMPTWDVSVTATVLVSDQPNGAIGVMPLLFNEEAFPGAVCDEEATGCTPEVYQLPGNGNEDVPQDATQFNWTVFCAGDSGNDCNASSNDVGQIMDGGGNATTVYVSDTIAPLNAGTHTTLLDSNPKSGSPSLSEHIGETFPVPIVNDDGLMVGFGYFRLLGVEGAPQKVIRGYFVSPVNAAVFVVDPKGGNPTLDTGVRKLALVN